MDPKLAEAVAKFVDLLPPETRRKIVGVAQLVIAAVDAPPQSTTPADLLGGIIRAVADQAPPPRTR